MSYHLEAHESLLTGIRRVVDEQAQDARTTLEAQNAPVVERVHDARKKMKRIRAALRLARPLLGKKRYKRENAWYRDTARRLAPLRDSGARLETLDRLAAETPAEASAVLQPVRDVLEEAHEAVNQDAARNEEAIAAAAERMAQGQARLADWPMDFGTCTPIRKALKRTYKRGRRGMRHAYEERTPAAFHEWRKRVKYLWLQTRLLRNAWPGVLKPWGKALHTLATHLGELHDLDELQAYLAGCRDRFDADDWHALRHALEPSRETRRQHAYGLGRRLYAERPKRFARRMRAYCAIWRAEGIVPAS